MSRESVDQYDDDGRLYAGYDYINQAWVEDGVYVDCGHPQPGEHMPEMGRAFNGCNCYGRKHQGERSDIWSGGSGRQQLAPYNIPMTGGRHAI